MRNGLPGGTPLQPPPAAATEAPGVSPGETIRVARFVVEGATLLTTAELEAATRPYADRDLDLRGLRGAAQAVADVYRKHGYFARTILPPQDVTSGVVRIQVIEGRFGKITAEDRGKRANGAFVQRVVGGRLTSGAPYSDRDLERGLLLANDLPGIRADGVLKAGSEPGTTDLALTVADTPLVSGGVSADNGGVDSTGLYRGIASLAFNNLLGRGDQVTALGLGSRHLGYGQLGWSVPLGTCGWRAGVYASYMRYSLSGDFSDLDGRGHADTQGLEVTYPVMRSTNQSLRLRFAYEHGHYHDNLLAEAIHRKQINRGSLSLTGDSVDSLGGGGRTRYEIAMTLGSLDLGGLPIDRTLDRLTARANGSYGKITFNLARDQRLGGPVFLRINTAGQWAMNNLDSSEQFALGGPNGIRAFPVNEGLGDQGAIASAELHLPISSGTFRGLDFYGFIDGGVIRLHSRTWVGWNALGADNVYGLAGAGGGIAYALPHGFSIAGVIAAPITSNPGGADARHNQDGSRRNARGWFTVSKTF